MSQSDGLAGVVVSGGKTGYGGKNEPGWAMGGIGSRYWQCRQGSSELPKVWFVPPCHRGLWARLAGRVACFAPFYSHEDQGMV